MFKQLIKRYSNFYNILHNNQPASRPVSTTSVEKSILCLFYYFFFALASILTARFNLRSIKERKNAFFHARSGNGPSFFKIDFTTHVMIRSHHCIGQ